MIRDNFAYFSIKTYVVGTRCSNEYPQHMFLWRNKQNYPSIIIKYPPYLFHCDKWYRIPQPMWVKMHL